VGQRGRADIGAVRVAEEKHDDFAAKIRQRARLAVLPRELERLAELRARDIRALEFGRAAVARRQQRERARQQKSRDARPGHDRGAAPQTTPTDTRWSSGN